MSLIKNGTLTYMKYESTKHFTIRLNKNYKGLPNPIYYCLKKNPTMLIAILISYIIQLFDYSTSILIRRNVHVM